MEVKTMKIDRQIILRVFLGLNVAGLLNGCTMLRDNMAKTTTDYNLVVEKAHNEMLLLNIVRASKRRPMYFTSLSSLRGKMTYSFGTGSTIPFGKIGTGTNGSYSVTPSVSYSNSPEFDLAVLDSKKFTCGIMTPVPMKIIEYYWSQGWPKEMLLHLFIERIEMQDEADKVRTYKNDPESPEYFNDFQSIVYNARWDINEVNIPPIGEVNANDALVLKNLVEVQKAGLILRPSKEKDRKELCLSQTEYVFECNDVPLAVGSQLGGKSRIYLRSPEAILYYLGELVRVGNKDPNISEIDFCDEHGLHPAKLFYAYKTAINDKTPCCVSVVYEGVRYIIPQAPNSNEGYCSDRSMHVLSLVSQLIGLQREVEEMPTTSVVSIIGQ
jgi:hypothetical protein